MNQISLLLLVVPLLPAADMFGRAARVLVELTLTPELAKMRLACMESSMASVSRNAVESFRTRWVSGSLSMSSLPS